MQESEVVQAIRGFKAQLRAGEGAQTRLLAERYLDVQRALSAHIEALAEQIGRLVAEGKEPNWSQLYRLDRFQRLQAELMTELARFNGWAADLITQEQLRLMVQGIDDAAAALETIRPSLATFVHKLPNDAIRGMVGLAVDGSPLAALLDRSFPAVRDAILRELIRAVALGKNPKVTAAAMRRASGIGLQRALTIARTEQLRVYREASRESYAAAGCQQWQRIGGKDATSCIACIVADGEIYPIEVALDDHPNGKCCVAGTLVSGPAATAATARQYVGEVVSISTAAGHLLTVTPNHPVLTDRGWVAAGLIREGDHVVSSGVHERVAAAVDPDEYQVPARIEDVRRARRMDGLIEVPTAAQDFHGDGYAGQCHVHVVRPDGLLRDARIAALEQVGSQLQFGGRHPESAALAGQGPLAPLLLALHAASRHAAHHLGEFLAPLGRYAFATGTVCGGASAALEAGLFKPLPYRAPRHAERLGDAQLGFAPAVASGDVVHGQGHAELHGPLGGSEAVALLATAEQPARLEFIREALLSDVPPSSHALRALASEVVLDRVLNVSSRRFSGHVHNLQTPGHWYTANSIIAHNCDLLPLIPGMRNPVAESARERFEGMSEATQRSIMGAGRFEMWKSGELDWRDLATHTHDPVWGGSIQPTPLTQLRATAAA